MKNAILLICSLTAFVFGGIFRKKYVSSIQSGARPLYLFNAVSGVTAAVILFLWGGTEGVSVFTLLLGVVFGLTTSLNTLSNMKALQYGPLSYTTVINSFSTIITAISGVLFFGESIGWSQVVGIALMLISFTLATEKKADEKKTSLKWLLFSILCFVCTGAIGIMQKVHQSSVHKHELNAFLVIAFLVSSLFSLLLFLLGQKTNERAVASAPVGRNILLISMLICGAAFAVNNKLNLYLSGVMDSAVFFPIVNGGGLVLTTLAAVLVFREKLSKKQWVGVAVGILSVLFLCNTFG